METTTSAASPALLFIPDISGFTRFVNETEISHSQHIIEELLETLIEANSLDLKISEIEGDAILFYKLGAQNDFSEIASQAKRMFVAFHSQLKLYDKRRICHCGACSAASKLTLKIIAHQGTVSLSKIRDHEKLFGPDVILVHRLLKNDIPEHEYLLLTENIPIQDKKGFEWVQPKDGAAETDTGKVNYRHISLKPLHGEVPEPPEPDMHLYRCANPAVLEKVINAPMETVYEKLIDLPTRLKFMDGVKEVRVHDEKHNRMNKIGTRHECVMEKEVSDLFTSDVSISNGKMQFSESMANMPMTCDFIAEKMDGQTKLSIHLHEQLKFPMSLLFRLFIKKKVLRSMEASMENFKKLCETGASISA